MRRQLDFDLLRTFVAIAETRTSGRAANKIGRTQAAVSMQVKKLEEMLAQPLLNLQILAPGDLLPSLPTVGLTVKFDLLRPPPLVVQFAEHLEKIVPTF